MKVEMIESYIRVDNDYQWNDNHGILIRCSACAYAAGNDRKCNRTGDTITEYDYCSKAVKRNDRSND